MTTPPAASAMDFFGEQDRARGRTVLLVVLFVLAVIFTTALIGAAGAVVGALTAGSPEDPATSAERNRAMVTIGVGAAAGALLVILGGTGVHLLELRRGGEAIATKLGGRLLTTENARDVHEQRVLNVVEEMAIASGVPVPPVYVMDKETGINAFAAGFRPSDAVIGVTRGTIETLDREELQGVIAHEFSHILNGDMRLNLRLVGVVGGLLALTVIAGALIRGAIYGGAARGGGRRDGRGVILIIALGVVIWIAGSIGAVFGRIIKASVSRQREYLADAAAVQFTRNPEGIGGALKKIAATKRGGKLQAGQAAEASHMFFSNALPAAEFGGVLSTHPPLQSRIRRVDPSWDGSLPKVTPPKPVDRAHAAEDERRQPLESARARVRERYGDQAEQVLTGAMAAAIAAEGRDRGGAMGPAPTAEEAGEPSPDHADLARTIIARIPQPLKQSAREPYGARAVVYGLLIDRRDESVAQVQRTALDRHADPDVAKLTRRLDPELAKLDAAGRLPLIEIALGPLRQLTRAQFETMRTVIDALISADERVGLFEWVVQRLVVDALAENLGLRRPPKVRYYALAKLGDPLSIVYSTLAHAGTSDADKARAAFESSRGVLGAAEMHLLDRKDLKYATLERALDELRATAPKVKRTLVAAVWATIRADDRVKISEAELARAIVEALGVPAPPILPTPAKS